MALGDCSMHAQALTVLGRAQEESQRCASKRPVVEWRVTPLQAPQHCILPGQGLLLKPVQC